MVEKAKVKKQKAGEPQAAEKAHNKKAAKDAFELVKLRNFFYRDNYRRLVALLVFMGVLLLTMGYSIYYLFSHRPQPVYFATNVQGGIIPLHKLSSAVLTTDYVLSWAARGASDTFTLNYVQYREQIEQAVDTYFTSEGGKQFQNQLMQSNNLQAVIQGKYIITAQPGAAPQLLWQGVVPSGTYQGRYGWQIDLPMVLTVQNWQQQSKHSVDVRMTVVRDSYLVDKTAVNIDATKGIGIAQMLVKGIPNLPTTQTPTTQSTQPQAVAS